MNGEGVEANRMHPGLEQTGGLVPSLESLVVGVFRSSFFWVFTAEA